MILLIRKCRNCDNGVGMVNGEYIHVNGKYMCDPHSAKVAK